MAARRLARLLLAIALLLNAGSLPAERIWWDGNRDSENGPPGLLLTDNEGYWGECVLTGVDYSYQAAPDNPPDCLREDRATFGRRLLDGKATGNWWVPVGLSGDRPLVVTLDFRRRCSFAEVDVATQSKRVALKLEVSTDGTTWQEVFSRPREDCPEREFHRLLLSARPGGRYLRLTVQAPGTTWLNEVLAWGEAEVSEEAPEAISPLVATPQASGVTFPSIPGIARTAASDNQVWEWLAKLGPAAKKTAVWSQAATWDTITAAPLLPPPQRIVEHVSLSLARNETECAALVLTNTSMVRPLTVNLKLGPFHPVGGGKAVPELQGELRVAGAIPSRWYGVNLGPLIAADNKLGGSLMQRYLTNGALIKDFPRVTLPPAGSVVLWLAIHGLGAKPGIYQAELRADPAPGLMVRAEVVRVTLPGPFAWWVQTWSQVTEMFPFEYGDRMAREVAYKQSLGVTVWNGFPTPGTPAALARERGFALFHVYGLPDSYIHRGYGGKINPHELGPADEQAVADHVRSLVAQAQALKLQYDDWFVELWDEPGPGNAAAFAALAKLVRKADPAVNIYCNPSFWQGWGSGGVAGDEVVSKALGGWYEECVDISCPLYLLLRDRPQAAKLFGAERWINASYTVSSHHAKSEAGEHVDLYRRLAWDAFAHGWNGWGFYSYYAPRGNPWNDFDASWVEDTVDYQVVYPGPRGPIPTRQSEAVREGYEDYCLLSLLQELGLRGELEAILHAYAAGEHPARLRLRALRAAARSAQAR